LRNVDVGVGVGVDAVEAALAAGVPEESARAESLLEHPVRARAAIMSATAAARTRTAGVRLRILRI